MKRIYLDHNASTPLDPRVLQAMTEELERGFGNPSSVHFQGQQSRQKIEQCRVKIARFFGVRPQEIIFTSGGTEGAALLLLGTLLQHPKGHIISSKVEHSCVYDTLKEGEKNGWEMTYLPVGLKGSVDPDDIKKEIKETTRLIALMAVNNETGVMTDVEAIASLADDLHISFIVDGVAWLGKGEIVIPKGVSALFFSGHKIHAPKGIGCVVCRKNVKLTPLFRGGGQEWNRRAGTENLAGIVALTEAILLLEEGQTQAMVHMKKMRDKLESVLIAELPGTSVNGLGARISNTSNLSFQRVDGEALLMNLDMRGVSVSHGSACSSGALEPSRILLEMDIPHSQARSSIRFSVGRTTTEEEIDQAIQIIIQEVKRLQK